MYELPRTIPDVKMLLALAPEELGSTLLFLLKKRNEPKFHTGNLQKELWGLFTSGQSQYPRQNENEINLALSEAWAWLQAQGLIVPDMENGQYGWLVLSRRARDGKRSGFQKLQDSRCDHSLSFDCPIMIP
jgi:transcriptional regulator with XRE-family HTH domain